MAWHIFCDFDGTIAADDVTDGLLERFAAPAWREVEREWKAGRIGSRECLSRQVSMLHMSRAQFELHLDTIELDPDFPAFVAAVRALGHSLTIVSDGLDLAIRPLLARHRLAGLPLLANALEQRGERAWRLAFPHGDPACRVASGLCKCASVRRPQPAAKRHRQTLLIGDGVSDFCAAHQVDLVFAKDRLIGHCARHGLPHIPIQGFAEARRLLGVLEPRHAVRAAHARRIEEEAECVDSI